MHWVKLSHPDPHESDRVIYINLDNALYMVEKDHVTYVARGGYGSTIEVKETIEEIFQKTPIRGFE